MKYTIIHKGTTTMCVSHYAGKKVVGEAKCAPGDSFDLEYGTVLATLRCDLKVAIKRAKRHGMLVEKYQNELAAAIGRMEKHSKFYNEALKEINRLTAEIKKMDAHL